ncbi:signal peptide peptidase SppA [Lentisalinibacter salinarum]|uniref:signal peptide peptidase SppA n=1 Tax=Lentisalinibacter salinarum TaxID=2992239 RepID=UPI00386D5E11
MALGKALMRVLRALWRGLDGIRKILHLLVLLFLFALVVAALSPPVAELPRKAALVIAPEGYLVEEFEGNPVDRALAEAMGDGVGQTRLRDVQEALAWAAEDDRIPAVVLELDAFLGGGLTKLQAVANAIETFKASGKPVIAMGNAYTQAGYYIAAHADEVWLQDQGVVFLQGYGIYRNYFRDAIEKLGIDWNVFTAGTYKSFAEPFTRNDMSEAAKTANRDLLDQLWQAWLGGVSAARGLDAARLQAGIDNLPEELEASNGRFSDMAVRLGLADRVTTRAEFREHMIGIAGANGGQERSYRSIGMDAYLDGQRLLRGDETGASNVAVVVAAGPVVEGDAPAGNIGGESTSNLIRRAIEDESVKALVLRVDSGGGSTFASELIFDEIQAFKATERPVIVSMSSVAASAGYWISTAGDEILAHPTTITGSIGVVGMFPTFQRTLEKVGINTDGVGTTALAGALRPDRALDETLRRTIEITVDTTYRDFVDGVAEQRGLERETVGDIAEGRVWTGQDALEFGLIDRFGDLDDAIDAAAERAGLAEGEYGVKYVERPLTPGQEFLLQLLNSRIGPTVAGVAATGFAGRGSPLAPLVTAVEDAWRGIARFNDRRGTYADCFCDILR